MKFGTWLFRARSHRGLSLGALSASCGIHKRRLHALENGDSPTDDEVSRLEDAMGFGPVDATLDYERVARMLWDDAKSEMGMPIELELSDGVSDAFPRVVGYRVGDAKWSGAALPSDSIRTVRFSDAKAALADMSRMWLE